MKLLFPRSPRLSNENETVIDVEDFSGCLSTVSNVRISSPFVLSFLDRYLRRGSEQSACFRAIGLGNGIDDSRRRSVASPSSSSLTEDEKRRQSREGARRRREAPPLDSYRDENDVDRSEDDSPAERKLNVCSGDSLAGRNSVDFHPERPRHFSRIF